MPYETNDEPGMVSRRDADDGVGDCLGSSYEREVFAESFEGNIR